MPKKRTSSRTGTRISASRRVTVVREAVTSADKLDLYKLHRDEYVAGAQASFVRVGPAKYLAITGRSRPRAAEFTDGIAALYNVAFTVKMAYKHAGMTYAVTKLEALWWMDDGAETPDSVTTWNWQLLLRVPPFVSQRDRQDAIDSLMARGKPELVRSVQLINLHEGDCVQILHVGPYAAERASIAKMHEFAKRAGRRFSGMHHEIYLSDPRRVAPENVKTILRQPVA